MKIRYIIYIFFIINLCTCKVPYTPAPITASNNYLVVEGFINITDSTYITLSRTVGVMAKSTVNPELKAIITIESNAGGSYPLKELGNGVYTAAPLNLSAANQYHLSIKTSNGNQYVSDFVAAIITPPIDSVTWKPTNTTLNIAVNTHDPKNTTRYYRWDYTEAWEFRSNFFSTWISDGINIIPRTPNQLIWDCFTGDASVTVNLGTSIQLKEDIISQQVINTIPSDAEKIGVKYTIGVKQYALTKDAYDYWTLLKKNTEQLGSIFDAQPSASIGNIHSTTNPTEPVIGYISAGTITNSRIFITKSQLPNWITTPFYPACKEDSIVYLKPPNVWPQDFSINFQSVRYQGIPTALLPISQFYDPTNPTHPGYFGAPPMCVDCTLRGSKIPPAYWK